ncbi:hypothetical protein ACHAPT_012894 [Fusarium lateritium]
MLPALPTPPQTLDEELKHLSLEATAERHLGSSSGLSFAKLTQKVLRRLTPDKADFVFESDTEDVLDQLDFGSSSDLLNLPMLTNFGLSMPCDPTLANNFILTDITEPDDRIANLSLPTTASHVNNLVEFYFTHSHTLYPVIDRAGFMATLQTVLEEPHSSWALSPLCLFRVWMVLAIGSTAYCSVSLADESESMLYYNKAQTFYEAALGLGDMPFAGVDDENIKPDGIQDQTSLEPSVMAIPLHILALRKISSKINKCVYTNPNTRHLTLEQKEDVIRSLHKELIQWRRDMPFPLPKVNAEVPHLTSTWYDFNYYTHLAMLYRPNPLFPTLDPSQIKTLAEAASLSIRHASSMHRQGRFAYNWLNFLAVYTSTISLVYAVTAQPDDLCNVLEETKATDDIQLSIELFDTLGTKFLTAGKIKGIFAKIVGKYEELRST